MTYTKEEVKAKTLKYFKGDDLATNVWMDKYCLKNLKGEFMEDSPLMMYESGKSYNVLTNHLRTSGRN